ncbi:acyl-CoA dehydrogenase [Cupriavidus basilensis]
MNLRDTISSLIATYAPTGDIQLPGHGHTVARWQLFATIAATHGPVAIKLFEAHADALAILAEVATARPGHDTRWAVWAAEPPDARVSARPAPAEDVRALAHRAGIAHGTPNLLNGRKAWCSGAAGVSLALLTCHDADGAPVLAAIDVEGPGVAITTDGWHAAGMGDTCSGDVLLHDCPALRIGTANAYLERPGFWHGGAGIAACWYGAALPLAWAVRDAVRKHGDAHAAAHLGAIDGDLHVVAALLREICRMDRRPSLRRCIHAGHASAHRGRSGRAARAASRRQCAGGGTALPQCASRRALCGPAGIPATKPCGT